MGTVSNPAKLSSIKAAWASTSNNFSAYYRGGSIVNIGDSASIPTAAAGMKMSQFNGVAAQHTTSWTTSYTTSWTTSWTTAWNSSRTTSQSTSTPMSRVTTTSWTTSYVVCLEIGTPILLANGTEIPVETLKVGMEVSSLDLPGLKPETTAQEYWGYTTASIQDAKSKPTKVAHILQDYASYMMEIWFTSREKPLRVTPSHPIFIYDSKSAIYRFVKAEQLDKHWHRLLNSNFELILIEEIAVYEGEFTIYKVDCSPLDVFFHNDVLGHNMKVSGGTNTSQVTSASTTTSWTSTWTTSWATAVPMSRTTSQTTSQTTSNVTSIVTAG
ncbi:MAG TPA: Hint domain-containing protein [Dongiaceae bacterium]|nr:Hint domain-containing protein [Dongiaceae bacterium]